MKEGVPIHGRLLEALEKPASEVLQFFEMEAGCQAGRADRQLYAVMLRPDKHSEQMFG
jgi:hypothetical protein